MSCYLGSMYKLKNIILFIVVISLSLTGCNSLEDYAYGRYEDSYNYKKTVQVVDLSELNSNNNNEDDEVEINNNAEVKLDEPVDDILENKKEAEKEKQEDNRQHEQQQEEKKEVVTIDLSKEGSNDKDENEDDNAKENQKAQEEKEEKNEKNEIINDNEKVTEKSSSEAEGNKKPVVKPIIRKESTGYDGLSNEKLSWWYSPGKDGGKSSINFDIAGLLEKYGGIWQVPSGSKRLYLTFDEGYEYNENTSKILDVLKEKNVRACFFITGHFLKSRSDLVKRMIDEGHDVANHTMDHLNPPDALASGNLESDITSLEELYKDKIGGSMSPFLRPPEGGYSEASLKFISDMGYTPTFWSFAYKDWLTDSQPAEDFAIEKITSNFHDGSIILLHAVSDTNVKVLGRVIDIAFEQGYSFHSLGELR